LIVNLESLPAASIQQAAASIQQAAASIQQHPSQQQESSSSIQQQAGRQAASTARWTPPLMIPLLLPLPALTTLPRRHPT
jgi:hypothetical protein